MTGVLNVIEVASNQTDPASTVNEALTQLMGRTVRALSRTTDAQPASPAEDDVYIMTGSASGTDWGAYAENDIAHYYGGAWHKFTPVEGIGPLWINDEDVTVTFDGTNYVTPDQAAGNLGVTLKEIAGTTYTVTALDIDKILVTTNGSPVTITLPEQSTQALSAGFTVGIKQRGAGQVTIATQGTDTIENIDSHTKLEGQNALAVVTLEDDSGPNVYWLDGRTAT